MYNRKPAPKPKVVEKPPQAAAAAAAAPGVAKGEEKQSEEDPEDDAGAEPADEDLDETDAAPGKAVKPLKGRKQEGGGKMKVPLLNCASYP